MASDDKQTGKQLSVKVRYKAVLIAALNQLEKKIAKNQELTKADIDLLNHIRVAIPEVHKMKPPYHQNRKRRKKTAQSPEDEQFTNWLESRKAAPSSEFDDGAG